MHTCRHTDRHILYITQGQDPAVFMLSVKLLCTIRRLLETQEKFQGGVRL